MNVAVVGASGLVGRELLGALKRRHFPASSVAAYSSSGGTLNVDGTEYRVNRLRHGCFVGVDVAFFATPTHVSIEYAPEAAECGAVVIDKSGAFRSDPAIPLVVPEVNAHALEPHANIVSSPNCCTIQLVMALWPLASRATLKRIVVCTYQSVSGTGKHAVEELDSQIRSNAEAKALSVSVYPHVIADNLFPHIDGFGNDGYSGEETKIIRETRRILGIPDLRVTCTCVRVPVTLGHAMAVMVETEPAIDVEAARSCLLSAPGVRVCDEPCAGVYPTPRGCRGSDEVWVGRLRSDSSSENGLWLWVVADNLRRGAALNAVLIAECLIARKLARG